VQTTAELQTAQLDEQAKNKFIIVIPVQTLLSEKNPELQAA
jgi:hypothetical protein